MRLKLLFLQIGTELRFHFFPFFSEIFLLLSLHVIVQLASFRQFFVLVNLKM